MKVIPITIFISFILCSIQRANSLGRGSIVATQRLKILVRGPKLASNVDTNDPIQLLSLVKNEADMVKIAAHNKLINIYEKNDKNSKSLAIIMQSYIEAIRSYGACNNLRGIRATYNDGKKIIDKCSRSEDEEIKKVCAKWKALFFAASFFSHTFKATVGTRILFDKAYDEAIKQFPDDPRLTYMKIKIACKEQLAQQNKNRLSKALKSMTSRKTGSKLDCVTKLSEFEPALLNHEYYAEEFYYLLGQTCSTNKDETKAVEYLKKGRRYAVYDERGRKVNKAIQTALEKIYTY